MAWQFSKHYTRDEARALLPQIRDWLDQLRKFRAIVDEEDQWISEQLSNGYDIGGPQVRRWLHALVDLRDILREFHVREIQIKEIDRGLVDFPAFVGGKEVFLCWEQDEDDVEYWHDLSSGYSGREHL